MTLTSLQGHSHIYRIFFEQVGGFLPNSHSYNIWTIILDFGDVDLILKVTGGTKYVKFLLK